ncbi:MoaB/Mog domain-containing protein [Caenorhabditis elegans]|uniref:MoaB/Mog domain-containing protein n=1 Tax=Caenorhabditis elegans TaxID=6239 RepID=G5EGH2_CAEEL|nr:MoaB/Mog domain-containing protein [Caenorhabditis elegans]CAA90069.2 MoaB/Mog domain-containing protein [Caenorhabditis elegans]|eukprot:NP_509700.2 MOlybdenum Cofactor biosynthesis [Caenorhabditis elegans]
MAAHHPRESQWPKKELPEARKIMKQIGAQIPRIVESIQVDWSALGRVVAEEVKSSEDMPPVAASTKDGYAVIAHDGIGLKKMVGVSLAGNIYQGAVEIGKCVRISTGGIIPEGADAVIMREYTELVRQDQQSEETEIICKQAVQVGENIRLPGSDVRSSDVIVPFEAQIGSAEFGILNAFGIRTIKVYKKPVVTVISTGSELVSPMVENVPLGMVRDSNAPQLVALFKEHGFNVIDGGRVVDDKEGLDKKLTECLEHSDVIVTTGGVSMGEQDYMKNALLHLGFKIEFGRVSMKPGLPCTVATRESASERKLKVVLALPGNPASAWVCSHLFAVPLIRDMSGYRRINHTKINVRIAQDIKLGDRPEFVRAFIEQVGDEDDGHPIAHVTKNQISSNIGNLVGAQVLLELNAASADKTVVPKNGLVKALILSSNGNF